MSINSSPRFHGQSLMRLVLLVCVILGRVDSLAQSLSASLSPNHRSAVLADADLMARLQERFPHASLQPPLVLSSFGLGISDYTGLSLLFPVGGLANYFSSNDLNNNGIPDLIELDNGGAIDPDGDMDGNGICNLVQLELGMALDAETAGLFDSDADGMSDAFEMAVGLNPKYFADAVSDYDGDGVLGFEEYAFGSSPLRQDSFNASRLISVYDVVETSEVAGNFDLLGIRELPIKDWEGWNGLTVRWSIKESFVVPGDASLVVRELTEQETAELSLAIAGNQSRFHIPAPLSENDWDGDGITNAEEYLLLLNLQPNGVTLSVWEIAAYLRNPDSDGDGISDADEDWTGSGMSNRDYLNGLSGGSMNGSLADILNPPMPLANVGGEESAEQGEAGALLLTVTYPTNGLVIP